MRSLVLMVWLVLAPLAGSAQAATELWCFGADWCRPCLRVGPVYERLIERGYTLRHVDYDRQRSVATAMRVGTLPSLVVVRDGRDVGRLVGANEISVNRVEQLAGPARQPAPAVALASASVPSTQLPAAGPEADGKLSVPPAVCAAICKISVWTGGNVWCGCTGTLVDEDHGRGLVLTCGHVFNEGNADILVTFPGGDRLQGRLLGRDPSVDLAAIEIMPVQSANPIEVAEDVAAPNSVVTTCGYGDDGCNKLAGSRGPVIQYVGLQGGPSDALMEIAGKSRNGDSGGPVLNTSFKQVGVLMGNDRRQTVNATGCGHMRRFLGRF
jgi:thiol-disulfide isomerase/thioredoxin